jgi:hypothetical protein
MVGYQLVKKVHTFMERKVIELCTERAASLHTLVCVRYNLGSTRTYVPQVNRGKKLTIPDLHLHAPHVSPCSRFAVMIGCQP